MRQFERSFWFLAVSITFALILSYPTNAAAQSRSLYVPVLQAGASETVIALNNSGSAASDVTLIARGYDGTSSRGSKLNSVKVVLPPQNSKTIRTKDVFGEAISKGWVEVQTSSPAITGSFFLSDPNAGTMEASELIASPENSLMFPKVTTEESAENTLVLVNTGGGRLNRISITLFDNSGRMVAQRNLTLAAYSGWSGLVKDLMPEAVNIDGYAVINSGSGAYTESLIGFETYRSSTDLAAIVAMPETVRFETGHMTQFASQAGYTSTLVLVNYGGGSQTVGVTAGSLQYNGRPAFTSSETEVLKLAPFERREVSLAELFDFSGDDVITGFVRYQVQDDLAGLYGYLELKSALGGVTVEPAQAIGFETSFISQIEDRPGSYSMLALMNPGSLPASIRVDAFDLQGYAIGTTTVSLAPNGYWSRLLAEIFPQTRNQMGGSVRITASSVVLAAQLMGSTIAGGPLAMLPAQGSTLEPYSISAVSARSGATVTSIDHGATLAVPPGALSQDLPIQITPLHVEDFPNPSATERLVGIVQGKPAGTQFRNPARLTFPLAEPLNPGTTLAVSIFNPQTHQYEPSGFVAMVEASGRSAWADVTHFTVFAVSTTQSVQISSLSPASGYVGAPITINGSGFGLSVDQNTVIFTARGGGVVTAPVVSASANVVTTVVPAGATNGRVYVQVGTVKSNGVRFKVNTLSNQAPSVNAGPDQNLTLSAGTAIATLAGTATDDGIPTGSTLTHTWQLFSGPASVLFADATSLNTSATFSVAGTYTLRLTSSDTMLTSSDDVVINVNVPAPINRAPTVNAGSDQTVLYPSGVNLAGTATDDGLPSGALTAAWNKVTGPGTVAFGNAAAFTTAATFSSAGTYTLRLTAGDGALTSTDDVVINVTAPANTAPVVTAGPAQTVNYPNAANLHGTATDDGLPAGSTVSVTWSRVSGAGSVIFVNANSLNATASFSVAGTYTLRLTATDGLLTSTADVIITVIASPSQLSGETIIDGFERPEYAAASAFKTSVSRTILGGAVTGFVVRTPSPCAFQVTPTPVAIYKMVPTVTTVPSSSSVSPGTFYDALVPLNAINCSTAKYIWVDVNAAGTYAMGSATAVVTTKGTLPAVPVKPMMMLMSNSFLTAGHYGGYVGGSESLGLPYLNEMIAHRLHPYGSYITAPPVKDGLLDLTYLDSLSFQKQDIDFSPSRVWLPNFSDSVSLAAANASTRALGWKSWFYTMDEPADSQIPTLQALLATQRAAAPDIKRMVTTVYRSDIDADIFVPVAEQFDLSIPTWTGGPTYPGESGYTGKELWLYVSCMSHGCSSDLAGDINAPRVSGSDSGAPDLTMDRSAAEPFGYMLLAQKYPSVRALLYYNTVEQYKLFPQGLDMWRGETFNFGGNLDGTLFWPGRPGIEGLTAQVPVVSVRMKLLREAQNLADLLSMLDQTWVKTQVDAIMANPRSWTRNISVFETLQRDAIQALNTSLTPPSSPTVSLSASPMSVASGQSSTLSWSSSDATSCTASGSWSGSKATFGSQVQSNLTTSGTYSLTCSGAGGTASRSVSVAVSAGVITPVPTIAISASQTSIVSGQSSTLSWSSSNATSCSASGGWNGSKAISGSEIQSNLTSSGTYALTCSGAGGTATRSVNVLVSPSTIAAGSLTLTNAGSGLDQTVTIDSPGQFRLVFEAGDNWGLSQWYDLLHDPSAQSNLIGPASSADITVAEPGLFQQAFYGTDPDDPKLYTRAAMYYFPTSERSFQVIENSPSRITVQASSHPTVNAIGVLTNITGVVKYTIFPNGKIYVHSETNAQNPQTISKWFNAFMGLENPGGTGTLPPDTRGWVRASAIQNPYSWTGISEKYLFAYWSPQTPAPYTNWSKASILMVPAANNPLHGTQIIHSWSNFLRWGYEVQNVNMAAGQTIAQDYLIQLGTEGSSLLPNITSSSVAEPIANSYLSSPLP